MAIVWLIFVVLIGACVGSFLNVVVWRMPRGQSIVSPGSHCPKCGKAITWYDNIPLISWCALGGKCRFCKTSISVRYLVVEGVTAVLVGGLYVWYFVARFRAGAGIFEETWPMYLAQAALLCALLASSLVDIELWIVPLEVCWFVSLVGLVCSTASPHPYVAAASPAAGAMAVAAAVGLAISVGLTRLGLLQPSFIDADDRQAQADEKQRGEQQAARAAARNSTRAKGKKGKGKKGKKGKKGRKVRPEQAKVAATPERITATAYSKAHGINPRLEILREVLFLAPAGVLVMAAYMLVTPGGALCGVWTDLTSVAASGRFAGHLNGFLAALFGYMIGGLWIWGMRILGTLGFGKEAMGLGDVHIMAAVGAVVGWAVPTVAFFVAPFFGLVWAVYLWLSRGQRELPYGPWLSAGTLVVMLFYDPISKWLEPITLAWTQVIG